MLTNSKETYKKNKYILAKTYRHITIMFHVIKQISIVVYIHLWTQHRPWDFHVYKTKSTFQQDDSFQIKLEELICYWVKYMALLHLVSKNHINDNQRTTETLDLRRHAFATKIIGIRVSQEIGKRLISNTLESNCSMSQLVFFWLQKCIVLM